ncbi:alpha/beta hydrolase fold family protein [Burkholderia cenocepacia]|uniref:Alpha/beta hydrolase fold family protein n=1 Tax=Burkholderia cenocepacia TaxID=95486 RepID=A0AAN0RR09_9BURK|nr:alpha/beta hydrolase fold family protein [Burkholderia cenocepacia]
MARHIPGPLYFDQHGPSGLPMLFLHSTPDDHRLWMYQTARFSTWFRTLAVDFAGYGRSGAAQQGVSIADQAEAAWEVVDQITSGPVIIHGNSMGSYVAMHMASQQASRVPCLILSGTGYLPNREPMRSWAQRYTEQGIGLRHRQLLDHFSPTAKTSPFVEYYARMVCELNNPSTLASIVAMNQALASAPEPDSFYEKIAVPTLIISGDANPDHHACAEALRQRIRDSELRTIEGGGHSVMQEAPWLYDQFTIEFLAKHGQWPGELPQ